MTDMEELLARSSEVNTNKKRCFRQSLDGRADEYMTAVEGLDNVVGSRVWEILTEEFGIDVGVHRVRHHLAGKCKCPRS